jgi:hypothetical protein
VLTYDIANERLHGTIGGRKISIWARSGGGRGSTVHPDGTPNQVGIRSWNSQRKQDDSKGIRGGPLPAGFYIVQKPAMHPDLKLSAYLEQTITSLLYANPSSALGIAVTKRDRLYIHGRGPKGSDGCIVPMEEFKPLMTLLKAHAPLALEVINEGVRTDKLPPGVPSNIA